ncbi:MAG: hypothetical protein ACHP9S_00560 [Terriglobales bacterium]
MIHFHLKYFLRTGTPTIKYGATFFSEIEALNAAGLANATRGLEPGYYSIQPCRRRACRPEPPDIEIERRPTPAAPPRASDRGLPGMLD